MKFGKVNLFILIILIIIAIVLKVKIIKSILISFIIFIISTLIHEFIHHHFLKKYHIKHDFKPLQVLLKILIFEVPSVNIEDKKEINKLEKLDCSELTKIFCYSTLFDLLFILFISIISVFNLTFIFYLILQIPVIITNLFSNKGDFNQFKEICYKNRKIQ